jgi:hypothetical protein
VSGNYATGSLALPKDSGRYYLRYIQGPIDKELKKRKGKNNSIKKKMEQEKQMMKKKRHLRFTWSPSRAMNNTL